MKELWRNPKKRIAEDGSESPDISIEELGKEMAAYLKVMQQLVKDIDDENQ
jgi:hypothetical protein